MYIEIPGGIPVIIYKVIKYFIEERPRYPAPIFLYELPISNTYRNYINSILLESCILINVYRKSQWHSGHYL